MIHFTGASTFYEPLKFSFLVHPCLKYLKPLYLIFVSCAFSFKIFEVSLSHHLVVLLPKSCLADHASKKLVDSHEMSDTKNIRSTAMRNMKQLRLEKKYTSSLILPCCDIHLIQLECIHPVLSLAFVPQTQAASSQLRQLRRNVPCSISCLISITWCIQNAGNATQCCDAMRLFLGKPIGRDALLATASTLSLNFASHSLEGGKSSRILHQLISSKNVAAALAVEAVLRQLM